MRSSCASRELPGAIVTAADAMTVSRDHIHAPDLVASLAASHGEQLERFLRARARRAADVADLVQEVYLRMLRVPRVQAIQCPEAYLFTVAQHLLQQHAVRESAAAPSAELVVMCHATAQDGGIDPALQLDADQCLEQLQQTLDSLYPKVREAFILQRRDGWSIEEIAAHLSTSGPMVKKYLMRASVQLRQCLWNVCPTQKNNC